MIICPKCGHRFTRSPMAELEKFIKETQPRLGHVWNLKRMASQYVGVRKFADIPHDRYEEVLHHLRSEAERILTARVAMKVLETVVNEYLKSRMSEEGTRELSVRLQNALRKRLGDEHWAALTETDALEEVKRIFETHNIWEYAYRSTGEVSNDQNRTAPAN